MNILELKKNVFQSDRVSFSIILKLLVTCNLKSNQSSPKNTLEVIYCLYKNWSEAYIIFLGETGRYTITIIECVI